MLNQSSVDDSSLHSCKSYQTWVTSTPTEEGFVYAVGTSAIRYEPLATALQRAKENARAEVAKQLMVRIEVSTEINAERHRSDRGVRYSRTFRQHINNTAPDIDLPGVTIVEYCVDRQKLTVFALAGLNQAKAIDGLVQQIVELDKKISVVDAEQVRIDNNDGQTRKR